MPIPPGDSKISITVSDLELEVFVHKPNTYVPATGRLLVVFHGVLRNADEYRDHARGMGERFGALVAAPKFDHERFSTKRYQFGGIFREDGTLAPRDERTYGMIPQIIAQIRSIEMQPNLPCYFIGHSAGGQFVVRMCAFSEVAGAHFVAANPGSHVFPTRAMPFPYGFGNLPPELSDDTAIRRYLAKPLTIHLGTADDHPDEHFDDSVEAMAQGGSRFERGQNNFALAQKLARENGWVCNWRVVTVAGIGHDHQKIFDAPQVAKALELEGRG